MTVWDRDGTGLDRNLTNRALVLPEFGTQWGVFLRVRSVQVATLGKGQVLRVDWVIGIHGYEDGAFSVTTATNHMKKGRRGRRTSTR